MNFLRRTFNLTSQMVGTRPIFRQSFNNFSNSFTNQWIFRQTADTTNSHASQGKHEFFSCFCFFFGGYGHSMVEINVNMKKIFLI